MNQDFGLDGSRNNRKRFRELDTFDASNNDFQSPQMDFDEFRPVQVIDYQNKTQNPVLFGEQTSFNQQSFPSGVARVQEIFPRKIIEYDHKSKVHPWNWFCPVIQMEYNHTKTGLSLHKHPVPKSLIRNEPDPTNWCKQEDHVQLRHSNWSSNERQNRFPYAGPGERYHQFRFEGRQNAPMSSLPSNENPPYNRRNPNERNWPRNYRDWNAPQMSGGYERYVIS